MESTANLRWCSGDDYKIALFYRYVCINNVQGLIAQLRKCCEDNGILGRILVSPEGLNGTLAGGVGAIDLFVKILSSDARFDRIDWKFTLDKGDQLPFLGLSIREVEEIISSGPAKSFIAENIRFESDTYGGIVGTGTHLTPAEFHTAIARKDGVILDVRNEFEYDIGHFEGSTNLKTFNYAETFDALDEIVGVPTAGAVATTNSIDADSVEHPVAEPEQKNIYMYCTGGIRCEKASAYLCAKGFTNVYQLEGGIHRYLESFPDGGLFQGKNFVFDSRVAVGPTATNTAATTAATTTATATTTGTAITAEERSAEQKNGTEASTAESRSGHASGSACVVGRCIDCSAPHDVYSGFIVCTVCRMPVLVCPSCVQTNPAPGEYHCSRHRDLKELYFTVLTQFTVAQLQAQLTGLQTILAASMSHKAALLKEEKARRRIAAGLAHHTSSTSTAEAQDPEGSPVEGCTAGDTATSTVSREVATSATDSKIEHLGKQRRSTIRKQVERLEVLIRKLSAVQSKEGVAEVALSADGTADDSAVDISCNPKTRGGWGFWKT